MTKGLALGISLGVAHLDGFALGISLGLTMIDGLALGISLGMVQMEGAHRRSSQSSRFDPQNNSVVKVMNRSSSAYPGTT